MVALSNVRLLVHQEAQVDFFSFCSLFRGERLPTEYPQVTFAYLEHLWHAGFKEKSLLLLPTLIEELHRKETNRELMADCYLKLAEWKTESVERLHDAVIPEVTDCSLLLRSLKCVDEKAVINSKAWHQNRVLEMLD